jgi:hypothetical protein
MIIFDFRQSEIRRSDSLSYFPIQFLDIFLDLHFFPVWFLGNLINTYRKIWLFSSFYKHKFEGHFVQIKKTVLNLDFLLLWHFLIEEELAVNDSHD